MAETLGQLGYRIVSGGTDTHLFLVDLQGKISGKEAEELLGRCGIIVNRNTIPGDAQSPTITSGIRIGTPAITTRGFKEQDVQELAVIIDDAIKNRDNSGYLDIIQKKALSLCEKFPIS